ncbi:hypothetical protein [Prosthecobacter sp.]|uniref:hypothetical protein n=1 Tax=Prosthecobacter sp. TaxID=1965333 RepID=UPI0037834298
MKKTTPLSPLCALLVLLPAAISPSQRLHADAATDLAQAMEQKAPHRQVDFHARLADVPRVHSPLPGDAPAFPPAIRQQVFHLDAARIQKLALNDPLLQAAYAQMFTTWFCGNTDTIPARHTAVREDLQRRGDAATPLLLQLLGSFPWSQYGENLFFQIEAFSSISLAPYQTAARECCQMGRPDTTNRTWRALSWFLSRRGTAQDLELLLNLKKHLPAEQRASISDSDIARMKKRLNGTLKPTEWYGRPPVGYHWPAPAQQPLPKAQARPSPTSFLFSQRC